jgi:hypothetical protein
MHQRDDAMPSSPDPRAPSTARPREGQTPASRTAATLAADASQRRLVELSLLLCPASEDESRQ